MGEANFMSGAMQNWPLLTWRLLDHAAGSHGAREIVSCTDAGIHRTNWTNVHIQASKLARALIRLGVGRGDRVATLAWNSHRHLESWFAVSGMGAVMHTVNPRLFEDQITFIINDARDKVLLFDSSFLEMVERLAPRLTSVRNFVLMTDRACMPASSSIDGLLCYEDMIAGEDPDFGWSMIEEDAPAGLCYTSGTTGNPKGVLYSHRSTVLHAWCACMADTLAIGSLSSVLPVVPMYHANAWGIPYAAAMTGAKLVFGGGHFDAPTLHRLIVDEDVTMTAAVPTVWLAMLGHLEANALDLGRLDTVVIGGAAAPRSMIETFQEKYGIRVNHAWGMTELSPLGSIGTPHALAADLDRKEQLDLQCKQGRKLFGVEMKIVDDDGQTLPSDGIAAGNLKVRGPWTVDTYFNAESTALDAEGYFDTGDIATIDPLGFMQITDRAKDVIKSGGEWISSIEIENEALAHPAVAGAAVIGIPHAKWGERPLLIIVRRPGAELTSDEVLRFLEPRIAKWWLPEEVRFVAELPHTATGKINKRALREQFSGAQ